MTSTENLTSADEVTAEGMKVGDVVRRTTNEALGVVNSVSSSGARLSVLWTDPSHPGTVDTAEVTVQPLNGMYVTGDLARAMQRVAQHQAERAEAARATSSQAVAELEPKPDQTAEIERLQAELERRQDRVEEVARTLNQTRDDLDRARREHADQLQQIREDVVNKYRDGGSICRPGLTAFLSRYGMQALDHTVTVTVQFSATVQNADDRDTAERWAGDLNIEANDDDVTIDRHSIYISTS